MKKTIKEKAQNDVKKLMKEWMSEGLMREKILNNAVAIGGWSRPTCERWYAEIKRAEQ